MDLKELAKKIRALRRAAGLSQEELAARAGVGRNTLQRIEGARGNPTAEVLRSLGSALNADFGYSPPTAPADPLPGWAEIISGRLAALESGRMKPSEPILVAWNAAAKEEWRRAIAMFFLTGEPSHLDTTAIEDEMRRRLFSALQFHKMEPQARARKR